LNILHSNGIASWQQRINNYLFNSYTIHPLHAACCRILYAAYLLFIAIERCDWLGTYPQVFYVPPPLSISYFAESFPPTWFFHFINISIIASLVCLLVGYKSKWAAISTGILILLFTSFQHAFGKINHIILLTSFPFVLASINSGAILSIDSVLTKEQAFKKAPNSSWVLVYYSLIIGFAMFSAGFMKCPQWLYFDTQATKHYIIFNQMVANRTALLSNMALQINSAVFWEIADYLVVILEVGFLGAIVHAKLFRAWLFWALLFHFGVLLCLNIPFTHHLFAFALFINWQHLNRLSANKLNAALITIDAYFVYLKPYHLIPLIGLLCLVLYQYGSLYDMVCTLLAIDTSLGIDILLFAIATSIATLLVIDNIRAYIAK